MFSISLAKNVSCMVKCCWTGKWNLVYLPFTLSLSLSLSLSLTLCSTHTHTHTHTHTLFFLFLFIVSVKQRYLICDCSGERECWAADIISVQHQRPWQPHWAGIPATLWHDHLLQVVSPLYLVCFCLPLVASCYCYRRTCSDKYNIEMFSVLPCPVRGKEVNLQYLTSPDSHVNDICPKAKKKKADKCCVWNASWTNKY